MDRVAVSINDLAAGEVLGQDIYDQDNKLLLKKGTVLLGVLLDAFRKRDLLEVYVCANPGEVNDRSVSEEIEAFKVEAEAEPSCIEDNPEIIAHLSTLYAKIGYEMRRATLRGQYNKVLQDELPEAVGRLIMLLVISEDHQMISFFLTVKSLYPEAQFESHAANVGLLSAMIGKWVGLNDMELRELAIGAILHDIGETQIPPKIMSKRGKLTESEWSIIKTHPILSTKILNKNKWASPRMLTAVLRHHERLDGTGYPYGIPGSEIPQCARIIAAAGSLDAMTSNRPFRSAMSIFGALADLKNRSFGQLDACITRTLYEKFLEYYRGRHVELSNGDSGIIVNRHSERYENQLLVKGDNGYYNMMDREAPAIQRIVDAESSYA